MDTPRCLSASARTGSFAQYTSACALSFSAIRRCITPVALDSSVSNTDFTVIPLSSVSQEDKERGRRAVQLLLEQTDSKDNAPLPRAEWVAPVLPARESTGKTEVV